MDDTNAAVPQDLPPEPGKPVEPAQPSAAPGTPPVTAAAPPRRRFRLPGPVLALSVLAMFAVGLAAGTWLGSVPRPGGSGSDAAQAESSPSAGPATTAPGLSLPPASSLPVIAVGAATLPSDGAIMGKPGAPVTVEIWADYQCPYCGQLAKEVLPAFIAGPVADGTARLAHRDLAFIGQESLDAAVFARYAGTQGKYWEAHDLLYASQNGENKGAFARDKLAALGKTIGLDPAKVMAAFDDATLIEAVKAETAEGVRIGINSTPTIVLSDGTRLLRLPTSEQLIAIVEAAAKP